MFLAGLILIGVLAGLLAGLFGLGGGIIIIPALIFFYGYSQKLAQGTSLILLLPPIGFFAAYNYYKAGNVNFQAALFIILGFLAGSYLSSRYVNHVDSVTLTRIFGLFLIAVAIKMIVTAK